MGLSYVPRHGDLESNYGQGDYNAHIAVARRNTPSSFAADADFPSAAHECIDEALRAFDPALGVPFEAFLALKARLRIRTTLARQAAKTPLTSDGCDGLTTGASQGCRPLFSIVERSSDDVNSELMVETFAATLPDRERAVALALAAGLRPSEVAASLRIGRSAVSNTITRLRPKAEAFWAVAS